MTDVDMADKVPQIEAKAVDSEYVLNSIIDAHKSDVKSIVVTSAGTLISAGRDEVVNFWTKKAGAYKTTLQFKQPKGIFVNSLAYADTPQGWRLFAGRKDGSIAMYGSGSAEPIQVYKEHQNNVCCLHINEKTGILMSGSWDSNVIIWPIFELGKSEFTALKLSGHSLSVWALATIPDRLDYYLTASADKTIRLWNRDNTVQVFNGHTDVVRALAVLSSKNFLSAGNDGVICYWNIDSTNCLGKFKTSAHDFIYSLTIADGNILTTGEDGTIEVWSMTETEGQRVKIKSETVITTPAASTWDIKAMPFSDISVAGSDGKIYIFTKDKERIAPVDIREGFDATVLVKINARVERNKSSDEIVIKVALDDGPAKLELRYQKGSDPSIAAEKFIRDNQLPISYLNEVVDYMCQNIPEARIARDGLSKMQPGQRQNLNGETYDHLFDVSLEDGTNLKMPYNRGEDPDFAAQRFIEKHNLPVKFLPLLSNLIRKETGNGPSSQISAEYSDPFSGEGRYIPSQNNSTGFGGFSGDPFTGSGGYKTGDNVGNHAVPLSSLPVDKKRPRGPLVPVPEFYTFGAAGASQKAIAKLKEINEKQESFQLSADQISSLEELFIVQPSSEYFSQLACSAFETALDWPIADLVPVLDFFRIALLHRAMNAQFCSKEKGVDLLQRLTAILVSEPSEWALKVMVCRCIANSFSHPEGRLLFSSTELSTLAPVVIKQIMHPKAALQIAATTALANWSLALLEQSQECAQLGPREDLLRALIAEIETVMSFGEMAPDAQIRLLQTIATLMWGDSNVISLAKNRHIALIAARLKDATESEDGKNVARDIVEMTYAV